MKLTSLKMHEMRQQKLKKNQISVKYCNSHNFTRTTFRSGSKDTQQLTNGIINVYLDAACSAATADEQSVNMKNETYVYNGHNYMSSCAYVS